MQLWFYRTIYYAKILWKLKIYRVAQQWCPRRNSPETKEVQKSRDLKMGKVPGKMPTLLSTQNFHICFLFFKHLSGITSYLAKISVKSPESPCGGSRIVSGQFLPRHHSWATRYISWRNQIFLKTSIIYQKWFHSIVLFFTYFLRLLEQISVWWQCVWWRHECPFAQWVQIFYQITRGFLLFYMIFW